MKSKDNDDLPYLETIEELEKVSVIRLKGNIDRTIIPVIEERIQLNRKAGSTIDKNVLVDYAKVENVDTATIAFHLIRLKEYEQKGYKIGFIHLTEQLRHLLDMFKQNASFQIYESEEKALKELNH